MDIIQWDGSFKEQKLTHKRIDKEHHNFYAMKVWLTWPMWHTKNAIFPQNAIQVALLYSDFISNNI